MAGHRVLADGSRKPTRSQRQLACWTERIGRAETSDDLLATSYRYVLAVAKSLPPERRTAVFNRLGMALATEADQLLREAC